MSTTPAIFPHFADSACVTALIVRAHYDERDGQDRMPMDTLHPVIRSWLTRKRFIRDEDIKRLEEIGPSLSRALLVLIQILPRIPTRFKENASRQRIAPSKVHGPRRFIDAEMGSIRELY
ncbi:hypothetical protein BDW59DRAFT_43982 [Aspergillus cavernicola]|uniref:Uncharacterized protein n=1 Tax=Aspergillus cavernicola TaxID=176166 RepID=A0ABR4ING2_9EURO